MELLAACRNDQPELCGLDHDRRAEQPIDQAHAEVRPGHHAACGEDLAVLDEGFVRVDLYIREACLELACDRPMSGCRAPESRPAAANKNAPQPVEASVAP